MNTLQQENEARVAIINYSCNPRAYEEYIEELYRKNDEMGHVHVLNEYKRLTRKEICRVAISGGDFVDRHPID